MKIMNNIVNLTIQVYLLDIARKVKKIVEIAMELGALFKVMNKTI